MALRPGSTIQADSPFVPSVIRLSTFDYRTLTENGCFLLHASRRLPSLLAKSIQFLLEIKANESLLSAHFFVRRFVSAYGFRANH